METQTPTVIKVEATVNVPAAKAWTYYTNPEHITQWNFASDDWQCPWANNDMRVGGEYSARMEAKDGSFGFEFAATYTEIEDGKKFTYIMGDGRKCTVSFLPLGNTTHIVVAFDAENQNPVEMQKDGWQAILNNYKKYAENH